MAKQVRTFLSRAVKLVTDHVTGALTSAETDLSTAASLVVRDQRKEKFGYVRVHVNIPCMNSLLYPNIIGQDGDVPIELPVPFVLPPLQEFLNETTPGSGISDGQLAADTPPLDLVEVSFSLDQRDEPAVIGDHLNVDSATLSGTGEMDYVQEAYRVKLSLLQKQMKTFGGVAPWVPETEVWSAEVPHLNFAKRDVDNNPIVWPSIEKSCDPMKSFLLTISMPDLVEYNPPAPEVRTYAAVSINVQLLFRHPIVARDSGETIQNLPDHHDGNKLPRTAQLTGANIPSGSDDLLADNAKGVQWMLKVLDDVFIRRLRGGYYPDGARNDESEQLLEDATYHVQVWPHFNNFGAERRVTPANSSSLPYVGVGTQLPTVHRHVMPISTPMTIHHVFAAFNWVGPFSATHPGVSDFETEICLAIGSGLPRGDNLDYRTVAYLSVNGSGRLSAAIDRIKVRPDGVLTADTNRPWDVEILEVPIVRRAANDGVGLQTIQGPPYYAGRSSTLMKSRTPVGGVVPGDNVSDISETFLESRWMFQNTAVGGLAGMTATDSLVGYGGHWLIIIGKKHLQPPGGVRT